MIADTTAPKATIDWTGISRRFFNPGELETFVAFVEDAHAEVVVEIGVNEGRNAQVLLSRDNDITRYIGIEVPPTYKPSLAVQAKEVPRLPGRLAAHDFRFELIIRPRGAFDVSADELPPADVVFIDGDHSWEAVVADTALAMAITKPGGLIVWHDYHELGTVDVKRVLDGLSRWVPIEHVAGTWFCVHRRPASAVPYPATRALREQLRVVHDETGPSIPAQ
jgi:predicted O-methyltransferase YrrM